MPEVTITKTEIITVNEVSQNSYGDLTFTDKGGKAYKVGAKRRKYFEKTIIPGLAVQLNYAEFKGNEYVYSANLIKDALDESRTDASRTKIETKPIQKELSKDAQIERAVWIKELGECLRSGEIDKTTPQGKSLRNAYYTEMCRVLEIPIIENVIVKEAKKLGATEIDRT